MVNFPKKNDVFGRGFFCYLQDNNDLVIFSLIDSRKYMQHEAFSIKSCDKNMNNRRVFFNDCVCVIEEDSIHLSEARWPVNFFCY